MDTSKTVEGLAKSIAVDGLRFLSPFELDDPVTVFAVSLVSSAPISISVYHIGDTFANEPPLRSQAYLVYSLS